MAGNAGQQEKDPNKQKEGSKVNLGIDKHNSHSTTSVNKATKKESGLYYSAKIWLNIRYSQIVLK